MLLISISLSIPLFWIKTANLLKNHHQPNKICEVVPIGNFCICNFSAICLHCICIKRLRKDLTWRLWNYRHIEVWRRLEQVMNQIFFYRQSSTKYFCKGKKSSKIGQWQENQIYFFDQYLTDILPIAKVLLLGKETG